MMKLLVQQQHHLISLLRFSVATIKKNPYQVLGLTTSATLQQIKKSYRMIAHQYHPDKNTDIKAQQIFVEAKQAYEILIDDDKRKQFDSENAGGRAYGFDKNPFHQFNDEIYKDKSRNYYQGYAATSSKRQKGQNISKEIKITFIESVLGANLSLELQRKSTCSTCHGNRCKPGTAPTRCLSCGGSGTTIHRQGAMVMHLECVRCNGMGLMIKNPCLDCKAKGIKLNKVKENISIEPGVENQQTITVKEKGHQSENGANGDLLIRLTIEKHPKFRKVDQDIHSLQWITISQAALGCKKQVNTIWGDEQIVIPAGSKDGSKIIIKNKGIKKYTFGSHIAIVRIKVPTQLNEKQRKIFQELAKEQQPPHDEESIHQHNQTDTSDDLFGKFKKMFK